MDTKSKSDGNVFFSLIAIFIGLSSLLYCSTLVFEPLRKVDAPEVLAQLSRIIGGGV